MKTERGEYLYPWDMEERVIRLAGEKKKSRAWKYRSNWTTLMEGSGKTARITKKLWAPWESELAPFREACAAAGYGACPMPGSYAWPWQEMHRPPPTNPTLQNRLLHARHSASAPRAWNEGIKSGTQEGLYRVYDLNSAYAAAALRPLPNPQRVVYVSSGVDRRSSARFGFYLVAGDVEWRAGIVPSRLREDRKAHWVTHEELECYDAHRVEVIEGCEWDDEVDLRAPIEEILFRFPLPMAKRVLRAFWGGWACGREISQFIVGGREAREIGALASRQFCPTWAAFVLSRVSATCALAGGPETVHVFTDSIMTKRTLQTGGGVGDWKLVHEIENPWIGGAGVWGRAESDLVKHAGRANPGSTTSAATRRIGGAADDGFSRILNLEETEDGCVASIADPFWTESPSQSTATRCAVTTAGATSTATSSLPA